MALTHSVVTLNSSTATALNTDAVVTTSIEPRNKWQYGTVSIQNTDGTITVYLGASNVSSTSYGVQLVAGASVTLDSLGPEEVVYAIAASGSPKVAVLMVTSA